MGGGTNLELLAINMVMLLKKLDPFLDIIVQHLNIWGWLFLFLILGFHYPFLYEFVWNFIKVFSCKLSVDANKFYDLSPVEHYLIYWPYMVYVVLVSNKYINK